MPLNLLMTQCVCVFIERYFFDHKSPFSIIENKYTHFSYKEHESSDKTGSSVQENCAKNIKFSLFFYPITFDFNCLLNVERITKFSYKHNTIQYNLWLQPKNIKKHLATFLNFNDVLFKKRNIFCWLWCAFGTGFVRKKVFHHSLIIFFFYCVSLIAWAKITQHRIRIFIQKRSITGFI